MVKNQSIADSVASEMAEIMDSSEYRAVFAKPVIKTAAKKEKDEDKKPLKHDHKKDEKCGKKCPAMKAKKDASIRSAIDTLSKISEVLDEHGLSKSAASALGCIVVLADECMADDDAEVDVAEADDAVVMPEMKVTPSWSKTPEAPSPIDPGQVMTPPKDVQKDDDATVTFPAEDADTIFPTGKGPNYREEAESSEELNAILRDLFKDQPVPQ